MQTKIPLQIIELEEHNFHIAISCRFFNQTSGMWIVDTGASKTVFDKNKIEFYIHSDDVEEEIHSAGISDEPLKSTIAILKTLHFEKLKIQDLKVALIDLSHINELYQKKVNIEICGLIGSDFLMKYAATIDFKKQRLVLKH